jgi:hypothetical protein
MIIELQQRHNQFKKNHCWQYEIRKKNYYNDLKNANLNENIIKQLTVNDFTFEYINKTNKIKCHKVSKFIEQHEWLGKMPNRPTHRFCAKFKNNIAGVIVMATPNTFSNILDKDFKNKEKLISRGACISWSPKNLASWLIMQSIKFMVKHTEFRIFTAYSDPEAKELGTIYQACNFFYLGNNFGAKKLYFDLKKPHLNWFSDREFRKQSKYKLYASILGIEKEFKKYLGKYTPLWNKMSLKMKLAIKKQESIYRNSCLIREVKPKHKYVYILGKNKKETKELKKILKVKTYPYPKERGL